MVSQFVTSLDPAVPLIRLERYRTAPGCDLHMLTNYFWNMALSEALYPTLHGVEVALRNTIHRTLTDRYGTEEWWDLKYTLNRGSSNTLNNARDSYLRTYGIPITPGRLVAELTFGFWVTVLSGTHVGRIWRYKSFQLVDVAFPNRAGFALYDIHQRFNSIRFLRNRVMHYEAIFDRTDLRTDHADIHQAIQWVNPDLHAGIHAVDSFLEVHQYGWERAYNRLHKMIGGP
jgi:hypothetical protein